MKKSFDKKILYVLLTVSVLLGVLLSRIDGCVGDYAVYEGIVFFCVSLFVYSALLKKYDGKEEEEDKTEEKGGFLSKRSLLLSSEETDEAQNKAKDGDA